MGLTLISPDRSYCPYPGKIWRGKREFMKQVAIDAIAPAPWKNGGGVTREIALCADDKGMVWRLSVADVARAGPFSAFAGLKRVLTVIKGNGLLLAHPDGVIAARYGAPVRFYGDMAIDCSLVEGPVRDFNLIYDPARCAMDVVRLDAGAHEAGGIGLLPLDGACVFEDGREVPTGAFALFDGAGRMRFHVSSAALLVTADGSGARQ